MSWRITKYFAAPLLAAFALGSPATAPHLDEPIPKENDAICDYESALNMYLLAYAYAREMPGVSKKFLDSSETELKRCSQVHAVLELRIQKLFSSLSK